MDETRRDLGILISSSFPPPSSTLSLPLPSPRLINQDPTPSHHCLFFLSTLLYQTPPPSSRLRSSLPSSHHANSVVRPQPPIPDHISNPASRLTLPLRNPPPCLQSFFPSISPQTLSSDPSPTRFLLPSTSLPRAEHLLRGIARVLARSPALEERVGRRGGSWDGRRSEREEEI